MTTRFRIVRADGSVHYTSEAIDDAVVEPRRRIMRDVADGLADIGARLQESHDGVSWRDSPRVKP
jgi:hypothetical protein